MKCAWNYAQVGFKQATLMGQVTHLTPVHYDFFFLFYTIDEETQQMHKEALDALTSIEVEFANLRDK